MVDFAGGDIMKRLSVWILGLALPLVANNQETFLRANELYKAGDYKQSLVAYESMQMQGSAVWLNIGNCLYQLDQYPQALVAYKRALKGATPTQYRTSVAYQHAVLQKLGKKVELSWWDTIVLAIRARTAGISVYVLQLLFLLLWFILSWLIIRSARGFWYKILIMVAGIFVFFNGMVLYDTYSIRTRQVAIVFSKEQLSVFSGPDERYHVLGTLAYAQEVVVEDTIAGWYKIRYDNKVGWVPDYVLLCV